MEWFCKLKKGIVVPGVVEGRLYDYKTTRDYDQMFTIFNGEKWVEQNVENFEFLFHVK